eukprot:g6489.t1
MNRAEVGPGGSGKHMVRHKALAKAKEYHARLARGVAMTDGDRVHCFVMEVLFQRQVVLLYRPHNRPGGLSLVADRENEHTIKEFALATRGGIARLDDWHDYKSVDHQCCELGITGTSAHAAKWSLRLLKRTSSAQHTLRVFHKVAEQHLQACKLNDPPWTPETAHKFNQYLRMCWIYPVPLRRCWTDAAGHGIIGFSRTTSGHEASHAYWDKHIARKCALRLASEVVVKEQGERIKELEAALERQGRAGGEEQEQGGEQDQGQVHIKDTGGDEITGSYLDFLEGVSSGELFSDFNDRIYDCDWLEVATIFKCFRPVHIFMCPAPAQRTRAKPKDNGKVMVVSQLIGGAVELGQGEGQVWPDPRRELCIAFNGHNHYNGFYTAKKP